jgi:citrate lyase subunit beta/citryl-CoA lyase
LSAWLDGPAAFDALREIPAVPGVQRLLFGSIDFQAHLGIEGDDDALLIFRSQLVLASRRACVFSQAGDDVERAIGQPGLGRQFGQPQPPPGLPRARRRAAHA